MVRKLLNVPLAISIRQTVYSNCKDADPPLIDTSGNATAGKPGSAPASQKASDPSKQNVQDVRSGDVRKGAPATKAPAKRRKLLLVSKQTARLPAAANSTVSTPDKDKHTKLSESALSVNRITTAKPRQATEQAVDNVEAPQQQASALCSDTQMAVTHHSGNMQLKPAPGKHLNLSISKQHSNSKLPTRRRASSLLAVPAQPNSSLPQPVGALYQSETSGKAAAAQHIAAPKTDPSDAVPSSTKSPKSQAQSLGDSFAAPTIQPSSALQSMPFPSGKQPVSRHEVPGSPPPPSSKQTSDAAGSMLHSHTGTDTPASSVYKPEAMTADSLLMVRRLPAVLTGSLPAMASLEAQATLPTGADMLRQLPKQRQLGLPSQSLQGLCHPSMVRKMQAQFMPHPASQKSPGLKASTLELGDITALLMQSSQDNRLQQMLCSSLLGNILTLNVPRKVATGRSLHLSEDAPALLQSAGSTDGLPDGKHSACGQQSQVAQAAPGLQSVITGSSTAVSAPRLVAMQQHEFVDIWRSPEKQAEECGKAHDAFPVMLSFLQAVLG